MQVNIQNADVTRLDIGHNYSTLHKPQVYINSLGELPRYKKCNYSNEGVRFSISNLELVLYDKLKEYKSKGNRVPDELTNQNLLRYELQLMKNIKSTLKRSEFTVRDLSNIDTYNQLRQLFFDKYEDILTFLKNIENIVFILIFSYFSEHREKYLRYF